MVLRTCVVLVSARTRSVVEVTGWCISSVSVSFRFSVCLCDPSHVSLRNNKQLQQQHVRRARTHTIHTHTRARTHTHTHTNTHTHTHTTRDTRLPTLTRSFKTQQASLHASQKKTTSAPPKEEIETEESFEDGEDYLAVHSRYLADAVKVAPKVFFVCNALPQAACACRFSQTYSYKWVDERPQARKPLKHKHANTTARTRRSQPKHSAKTETHNTQSTTQDTGSCTQQHVSFNIRQSRDREPVYDPSLGLAVERLPSTVQLETLWRVVPKQSVS